MTKLNSQATPKAVLDHAHEFCAERAHDAAHFAVVRDHIAGLAGAYDRDRKESTFARWLVRREDALKVPHHLTHRQHRVQSHRWRLAS